MSKEFTQDDVRYVKSLLNRRYNDCNVKIYEDFCYLQFVLNEIKAAPFFKLIKEFLFCLKKKPSGVYSTYTQTAYVFPKIVYKYTMDEIKDSYKLLCASTLIHELRHYFQHTYMKVDRWDDVQFEKDAMKFEMRMFLRNYDELDKLIK